MKIAILYPSYEGSNEAIRDLDPVCDPTMYLEGHECQRFPILKARAAQQVIEIARQGFDVAINLCDGAWHGDTAGVEVVQALERVNLAFTGAGSTLYDPSREAMKMACHAAGVKFPAYVMARRAEDTLKALRRLRFPMLVKHPQGYSSVGLTPESRVEAGEALRRQVELTVANYGAALIEEFIEGREFTVLVSEARDRGETAWALTPVEFLFPAGETFKHFDLKWKEYEQMTTRPVSDEKLAERLRREAAQVFSGLGCEGYARCDFRMDASGELYLLEVNPNCAVFYPEGQFGSADLILAADPAGHRGFLAHQIACALERQARRERAWELEFTRETGFGMVARREIRAGEVVERYEERPATMVSREHAERNWTGDRRRWFDQYAWPVGADTHVMWNADPEEWRPINHSCDPNTWLVGLDVVARRDLAMGEELTIDYATFCGPEMEQFECGCGAAACRQVITGDDCMLAELRERYRGHVTGYIRERQERESEHAGPFFVGHRKEYGVALTSRLAIRAGEILCGFHWGEMQDHPTVHSIQVAERQHAEPRPFVLRYINHSCAPNVMFDTEAMVVRAVRDVAPGDELTFFYPSTEWEMTQPFHCRCDARDCLGWIAGAARIEPGVLERYDLSGVVAQRVGSVA